MLEAHSDVPMSGAILNTLSIRLDTSAIAFILDQMGMTGVESSWMVSCWVFANSSSSAWACPNSAFSAYSWGLSVTSFQWPSYSFGQAKVDVMSTSFFSWTMRLCNQPVPHHEPLSRQKSPIRPS
jgi:hypothetical protein